MLPALFHFFQTIANSKFLNSYHRDDSVNDKKAPEKFDWEKAKDEAVKAAKKDSNDKKFLCLMNILIKILEKILQN